MKTKNKMKMAAAMSLGLLATSGISFAQSTHGNGGGLIYLNGVPQIADPFVKSAYAGETMKLSPEMVKMLSSIKELLVVRDLEVDHFFKDIVFSDLNEYVYIDKLPCEDSKDIVTQDGQPIIEYGCTLHKVTYILKNQFLKLNFQDQALALIHERLHALAPDAAHHWVTEFVSGIRRCLELRLAQLKGDRARLSDQDFDLLNSMYINAIKLGIDPPLKTNLSDESTSGMDPSLVKRYKAARNCVVARNGGGMLCAGLYDLNIMPLDRIGLNNFFGIGSSIRFEARDSDQPHFKGTVILDSIVDRVFATDSLIQDSRLSSVTLEKSEIKNSKVAVEFSPRLIRDSKISDSFMNVSNLSLEGTTFISASTEPHSDADAASFVARRGSILENCIEKGSTLELEAGAKCSNSILNSPLKIGKNSTVSQSSIVNEAGYTFSFIEVQDEVAVSGLNLDFNVYEVTGNYRGEGPAATLILGSSSGIAQFDPVKSYLLHFRHGNGPLFGFLKSKATYLINGTDGLEKFILGFKDGKIVSSTSTPN